MRENKSYEFGRGAAGKVIQEPQSTLISFFYVFRVMIHVVAQCHEEGLEHLLRSYVKVSA